MRDGATEIAIRPCRTDDLPAVLSIHSQHGNRPEGPPTTIESTTWALMIGQSGFTVYLAELDGRPVGTASMMLMPNLTYSCAPTAFIEGVMVLGDYRRRGVATAMLNAALSDASRAGVDKVQLLAHKRHATDGAHALYVALGFEAQAEGFRFYLKTPDVDRTR